MSDIPQWECRWGNALAPTIWKINDRPAVIAKGMAEGELDGSDRDWEHQGPTECWVQE